ncbi:MAG: response regulator [Candidatus Omnitrophica bacterium]|nr:response regulator [Candidatus Omnitrophota bacterium]
MAKHTILLVDDERNILNSLTRLLKTEDRQIITAETATEAWEKIKSLNGVDLVITDYRLPDISGIEFLIKVKHAYPDTVRMLITGYPDLYSAIQAINMGQVYRYIPKPWDNEELKLIVNQALDYYDVIRDNRILLQIARQHAELLAEVKKRYPEVSQSDIAKSGVYIIDEQKVSQTLIEFMKKYYPHQLKE